MELKLVDSFEFKSNNKKYKIQQYLQQHRRDFRGDRTYFINSELGILFISLFDLNCEYIFEKPKEISKYCALKFIDDLHTEGIKIDQDPNTNYPTEIFIP